MSKNTKSLIIEKSKVEAFERIAEKSGITKASIFNSFIKLCASKNNSAEYEVRKKSKNILTKEKTKHVHFALTNVVAKIAPNNVNWNATFSEYLEDFIKCNSKITAFDSVNLPPVKKIYLKEA
ncbi:hypothetical protein ALO82_200168 [Pseudomonas syringae pv. broussonetiae]|uniref:hypothetical protein n=1 Tax=Pseudomonas savastanoi TaxID=29438 RepID=UPI0006E4DF72|nr:hypothetical protein [Pseudomonas savastanoi]KPW62929.1 hypothetical protein ALO82_200168 [Pseudomonas syringae pv. broussonetiae]KWT09451.1 hypothetical protein AL047_16405 [Pseudomonas syringae pv. broussonetiae]